jgi:predicted transcriptional regulator
MNATTNALTITFGQADEHRAAARDRLERAEAGETGEAVAQDAQFVLNFEEFADVERLMRSSNLDLLEAIVDDEPESIRQTAAVVDRDYREVHRNLKELQSLGVIEFDENGTSKRPILRGGADRIDFSFTIGRDAADDVPSASA